MRLEVMLHFLLHLHLLYFNRVVFYFDHGFSSLNV